ncbi:hypothetical protein AJ78_07068 [Emergomyces pasteurianus Ep9510]|uniref:Protein transport protein sec16 n=1 Tax=Emergomyces pasteurianus Ep9510 TaxID=1447872 RepID=A0A1J9P796_9EURO|nr:hypothetical protein AJ78_07068 [Emergomyces pasteurianus Ep9510]
MAHDIEFASEYRRAVESNMIQPASWNPALRPDHSLDGGDSSSSLVDSNSTSLPAKLSDPPSNNPPTTPSAPSASSAVGGDYPAESSPAELSNVFGDGRDAGVQITLANVHSSSQNVFTETPNNLPSYDLSPTAHEPVQPFQSSPPTEQSATCSPTASVGFPWGKDTDIDSSWDISRSTTDQFDGLGITDRTNSFPNLDDSINLDSHGNGDPEAAVPGDNHDTSNQETTHQQPPVVQILYPNSDDQHDFLPWSTTTVDEDPSGQFFNQLNTQTKPIYTPLEAESRFEEGMPLINNTEPSSPTDNNQADTIDAIFKEDEPVDDADFFTSKPDMPPFNRKSTSQVLDSLRFEHNQTMTDSPSDAAQITNMLEAVEEPLADKEVPEDDLVERWKAALDDDDLLIDDDLDAPQPLEENLPNGNYESPIPNFSSEPVQTSPLSTQQQPHANPYTPHQPSSSDMMAFPNSDYGLHDANATTGAFVSPAQQYSSDPNLSKPESFSNQAKAGYQSPYDLPMEIIRPKHRTYQPSASQPPSTAKSPAVQPPPRKSSMAATRPSSSSSAYAPSNPSPPHLSHQEMERTRSSTFFEELPVASRSRPSSTSKYTPSRTMTQPVGPPPSNSIPPNVLAAPSVTQEASDPFQLQKPELLDPYSSLPVPSGPTASGPSGRYSPRPPTLHHPGSKPPSSPRYSPAPPPSNGSHASNKYMSQPPTSYPPSNILPFQPRTSSPLAQQENVSQAYPHPTHPPAEFSPTSFPAPLNQTISRPGNSRSQTMPPSQYLPHVGSGTGPVSQSADRYPPPSPLIRNNTYEVTSSHAQIPPASTAMPSSLPPPNTSIQHQQFSEPQLRPPRRSQTQSPSRHQYEPISSSAPEPFQRPASAHSPVTSLQTQPGQAIKSLSAELDFIYPTDGQELDPLQRWKGAPIFKFGFGGVIASSFPKRTPRYATGQLVPKIKPTPGETKVRPIGNVVSEFEPGAKFPGPLRSKSKKKDIITWLSSMISRFENDGTPLDMLSSQQHNEKILLWKIVRVMVEHDGLLSGNPDVENSVRTILSPIPETPRVSSETFGFHTQLSSVYESISGEAQSEPMKVDGIESIRRSLLAGEREKAVWEAVDRRLWGHAMLVSSTLDKSVWKQVAQEFIRREIKALGNNTESMAALYEVFAGNLEESVDELVPPSARAGLQMVSKIGGPGHMKNALGGLDKWQETLCLILSNRSPDDHVALLALSRLLAAYGRIEASHICALFAKSASAPLVFSGPDDPQSQIVLLGADHRRYPFTFANDLNSIILTEVYEFAFSILSGSAIAVAPHFQAFKLEYALSLAENGSISEAQQYCDAIGAILKSTTKPSPYYHQRFFSELDELTNRLRQSPTGGSSSWMSKPSMEKVSGSILAKFNSFVAGDDSDGASTGSGRAGDAEIGPFAKMVGTPPISRSPSVHDSYAAFGAGQTIPAMPATSRYAPGNQYAPYSSPDQYRGRGSLDSQRSPPSRGRSYSQSRPSQELSRGMENNYHQMAPQHIYGPPSVHGRVSTPPQHSAYAELAPVEEIQSSQSSDHAGSEQPIHFGGYQPTLNQQFTMEREAGSPAAHNTGYEPPAGTTGYEPPSYVPEPVDASELDKEKPKKSFMNDDDEDFAARDEAVRKAEKERKDREADEAFKKAAEADAKKPASEKKGWFSWWSKKDPNASSTGGPIRAKLGEENSFYYDKELKRWVNKKDPNSATATARSTPPPPKGPAPPSRSVSANNDSPPAVNNIPTTGSAPTLAPPPNPSSGPPSQAGDSSPQNLSPGLPSLAAPSAGSPYLMPRSVSTGPPSRPGTALSNASSIDDLIGAPQARKANTVRGKKKGRGYVDVMAK